MEGLNPPTVTNENYFIFQAHQKKFADIHTDFLQLFPLLEEHPLLSTGMLSCWMFQLRSV